MGVKGLWKHLPEVDGSTQPLMDLAIKRGFEANPQGLRAYRVGIDISLWLFHARKATGQARNGELQTFFQRCCRLLGVPILPLFVFDGPKRPTMKRNKEIEITEDSQLNDIRELIIAFGFECITAPGEAEAALAQLNAEGIIDAVLTDDIDCFLFGAKTVLRNVKSNHKLAYMEHLKVHDIQMLEDSHFSREELIFIALLRGGDYDCGLTGCGINTAVNLREFGLGKRLIENWTNWAISSEWPDFLSSWKDEVQEKLSMNIAITDEFPKDEILSAYLNPAVFTAEDLAYIAGNLWKSELDLSKLAHACLNKFQWSTKSKILQSFKSQVWPGAVMRLLLQIARNRDNGILTDLPFELVSAKRTPKEHANHVSVRVSTMADFEQALIDGIFKGNQLYGDTISLPSRNTSEDPVIGMATDDDRHTSECFWIHHSIIVMLCNQHSEAGSSTRGFNVPGNDISCGSDDWLMKDAEAAEDIIYISSDSGDSNNVIYVSSGSD